MRRPSNATSHVFRQLQYCRRDASQRVCDGPPFYGNHSGHQKIILNSILAESIEIQRLAEDYSD